MKKRILFMLFLCWSLQLFGQYVISKDSPVAVNIKFCTTISDSEFQLRIVEIESYIQSIDASQLSGQEKVDFFVIKYKVLLIRGDYASYIKSAEKLLKENESAENKTSLFAGLYKSYYEIGAYDQALKYLNFWEQEQDRLEELDGKGKGKFLLLGEYYYRLGRYDKALENYKDRYYLSDTVGIDHYYLGFLSNNVGLSYTRLKQYDSAFVYFDIAEKNYVYSRRNDASTVANLKGVVSANRADIYLEIEDYKSAISQLKVTLNGVRRKNIGLMLQAYVNLAFASCKIGDLNVAQNYLDSSEVRIEDERITIQEKVVFNQRLAEVYSSFGNYEKGNLTLKKYIHYTDSLNALKDGKYAEFAVLLELQTREKQIQDQEIELLEKRQVESENDQLKTILWITFITVILIIIAVVIIIRLQRKVRRTLTKKNYAAQQDIQTKDARLKEIHHRVKNNLQVVSGFLQLQSNSSDSEKVKSSLKDGIARIQTIAELHNVIYQERNDEVVEMYGYLERIVQLNKELITKNIKIELDVDEFELSLDKAMGVAMIMEELITNSIKHAFKGKDEGWIKISLHQKAKNQFRYQDSGEGFDIGEVKETSLGLTLIKIFARRLKATYQNDYKNATFYFEFE